MNSELLHDLLRRLDPLPSERAVVCAIARRADGEWHLTHASVLVGPPRMGALSWGDWGRGEMAHEILLPPPGLPAALTLERDDLLVFRRSWTVARATRWLGDVLEKGHTPEFDSMPRIRSALLEPSAPVLAQPLNGTPASRFVTGTVRPVVGFLFAASEAPDGSAPERWHVGGHDVSLRQLLGIDAPADHDSRTEPFAPAGLLLGRVSRRAWIARVGYRTDEELFDVWLRMERARIDPFELELELQEHEGDELIDSRRIAFADIGLPARVRGRLGLTLPTLGRGLKRTITLYHRDGEVLDRIVGLRLVERLEFRFNVGDGALPTMVVGDKRPPAVAGERLSALRRVEEQYASWFSRGTRRRLVSGPDAVHYVTGRIRNALDELLVIDPYFGRYSSDWSLLDHTRASVRVLTGSNALAVPAAYQARVRARAWSRNPPPYHDRFFLWGRQSGINVGASANGLAGSRLFRIDELSGAEVRALRILFESWWQSRQARPL